MPHRWTYFALYLLLSLSASPFAAPPLVVPPALVAAFSHRPTNAPGKTGSRRAATAAGNDGASNPRGDSEKAATSDGGERDDGERDGGGGGGGGVMSLSPLRRLVLVGGGHGHVQVIKALNRSARPQNLRVTLVDPQESACYSGMVPGCVSGLYSREQTLIRLRPLAEWAGIEFVNDEVVGVDPGERRLFLKGSSGGSSGGNLGGKGAAEEGRCVEYDAVSFDIGSASRGLDETPGARERCIPTRPISDLVRKIDAAEKDLKAKVDAGECGEDGAHVVVIGGGAAGIELSMAIRARWGPLFDRDESGARTKLRVTLLDSGDELLPSETAPCREALRGVLSRRDVEVRYRSSVREIDSGSILLEDGAELPYTHCLWATGAASHPLADALRERGVAVTDRGWIRVNPALQSVSHPSIFAAGDCCHIEGLPDGKSSPPKAGVYAVRSGPILIENLTRYLGKKGGGDDSDGNGAGRGGEGMVQYAPQDDFLKLLMCGDGTALGFRFGIPLEGRWVWDLKDRIDTMFMELFDAERLPPLSSPPGEGGGGGAEVGDDDDGEEEGGEGKYDTSQYDATKGERRDGPLPAREAAALLRRTDDDVDYEEAWRVLRDMMADDSYRDEVLGLVAALSSSEEEEATLAGRV